MDTRFEMWLARAMICLFEMIFIFMSRFYLCGSAWSARHKWSHGKKQRRLLDTGKQPKWLVWLLYTDIRTIRNQSFGLRLNMVMWIAAVPYIISELALGWIAPPLVIRIILAVFAAFFALCSFISACIDHKRSYGHALILRRKPNKISKSESSIFDLILLGIQLAVAYCYLIMHMG